MKKSFLVVLALFKGLKRYLKVSRINMIRIKADHSDTKLVKGKTKSKRAFNVSKRKVKVGYSMKALFFQFFVPLVRLDVFHAIWYALSVIVLINVIGTFPYLALSYYILEWFWVAYTNKLYLHNLLSRGYLPASQKDLTTIFSSNYVNENSLLGRKLQKAFDKYQKNKDLEKTTDKVKVGVKEILKDQVELYKADKMAKQLLKTEITNGNKLIN